ncbi:traB domain-containing protein isoform X1 [Sagmatias obliquidens]|uniref:traB domain-containing protein isoform X1 n=1 Tax=Sagmatias obliquidens TaxID=3371155 RepID=UPI000F441E9E|nr:traB domain-containing protein isoform X1 [Lagenorhynchus obliquidens]
MCVRVPRGSTHPRPCAPEAQAARVGGWPQARPCCPCSRRGRFPPAPGDEAEEAARAAQPAVHGDRAGGRGREPRVRGGHGPLQRRQQERRGEGEAREPPLMLRQDTQTRAVPPAVVTSSTELSPRRLSGGGVDLGVGLRVRRGSARGARGELACPSQTIREVQPDVVVVELCQYRVSMLKMDERTLLREAKEISLEKLQQAVRQNGVMSGLMQMLLLKVSAHITEQLGMAPGGEFREAFKEASKVPFCKFHLGDRPIPVTFKRAIAALSFWQKIKLAWGLCFLSDPISKDDVERCKQKDLLEQMMAEMIGEFPDLHRTIVSERDIYLTYMLRQAARRLELPRASDAEPRKCVPSVVVGVVGMGHVPGIEKNWTTDLNIQEIMTVPPPSVCGRVSWLAAKAAFLGLLGYGLYWMGRRASSLVLSLPAAQYCLQRASEAWPHK